MNLRKSRINIKIVTILSFIALLSIQPTAEAQSGYCSYEAMSGTRTLDYTNYYMELYEAYISYQNENSRFVRDLNIQFAKSLIKACPDFYQRINKNELPLQGNSTGNNLMDLLKDELVKRDDSFKQLKQDHPKMKRWLNRID